jgi:hypothetical protein
MNSSRPHSVHSKTSLSAAGLRGLYRHQGSVLAAPFVQHELSGVDGRGAGKISIQRPKSAHLHEEEIV